MTSALCAFLSVSRCLLSVEIFLLALLFFFFSSRRRHTRSLCDWSSDVCSSDLCLEGDRIATRDVPALTALNERLRDDYIADCQRGIDRWNRTIKEHGIDVELRLPHRGFHRAIGSFGEARISPDGRVITEAEWDARRREW